MTSRMYAELSGIQVPWLSNVLGDQGTVDDTSTTYNDYRRHYLFVVYRISHSIFKMSVLQMM